MLLHWTAILKQRHVHLGIFFHNSTSDCIIYLIPQAESYNSEICDTGPAEKSDISSYLLTIFKLTSFLICIEKTCLGQVNSLCLIFMAIARGCYEFTSKFS